MKKNLLLMHLESLNCLNYKMNEDLFPNLKEIEKHCIVFDHYYSTATSTLMVIGDLLYGGMKIYESCESLDDIPESYCYTSSIFDDLKGQGYNTGIYIYPNGGDRDGAELRHLAGFENRMELIQKYSDYLDTFRKKMSCAPFALMSCNYISNLSLNSYVDINNYDVNVNNWEAGFRCMDQHCGTLFAFLQEKGLLEHTIVIFYGDHGDDYWGHGMHKGLTHAIEPNNLLIHTPLFIWDGNLRKKPEHDLRLVQTSDLREIMFHLLNGAEIERMPVRRYAISRNEYAAQPLRIESFNKAYSITDGRYFLMVSGNGLNMYDCKMDPSCMNDLLCFFSYENGILKENERNEEYGFHFKCYWDSREQRVLRQKFYELYRVLYENVLELYIAGGQKESRMLQEMRFDRLCANNEKTYD
ncbi:MAG: sulfatase-like hydrolase/transferase [Lachnospiraceae bacterium]